MSRSQEEFPAAWRDFLGFGPPAGILDALEAERAEWRVFPPAGTVFTAFRLTVPEKVRVVLLGQDPYHDDGQAEGLAFSVAPGVKFPPSLRNIFKEYASDLGRPVPESGSLRNWAENGVLLLNSVLTVRAHETGSHRKLGWEEFTDRVIAAISEKNSPTAFLLWGSWAQSKKALIDAERHFVLESAHPSPLSAYRGFFGSRPFSRTAEFLKTPWPEV